MTMWKGNEKRKEYFFPVICEGTGHNGVVANISTLGFVDIMVG